MRKDPTPRQRQQVRDRAGGRCEYCRHPDSHTTSAYEVDHTNPVRDGGQTVLENLAYSCGGCNNQKSDRTEAADPETGGVLPLFNPRRDLWNDHFVWSSDFIEIMGKTPTGRAAVVALHLNRPGLINLRRALIALGLHPPAE